MKTLQLLLIGMAVALTPGSAAAADSDLLNGVNATPKRPGPCAKTSARSTIGDSRPTPRHDPQGGEGSQDLPADAEVLITYVVAIHCPMCAEPDGCRTG